MALSKQGCLQASPHSAAPWPLTGYTATFLSMAASFDMHHIDFLLRTCDLKI